MSGRIYTVLFLCTGNSARSIIAEAIMNRLGEGRFQAFSAGSHPKGESNPNTLKVLQHKGYDTAFARSKSWQEFEGPDAPEMDFVFTVCDDAAAEACPVWPGHPVSAHWGIPDPAAVTGSHAIAMAAFYDAYRMLEQRISLLVSLPIEGIDRLALRHQLERIGNLNSDAISSGTV